MNLFGATFGFHWPWLLAGVPVLIGMLVYVYLRRGRGKRIIVGTLLILKELRRPVVARQKFMPPFRFFFELLVLILLMLGAAELYERKAEERTAIVIDNSLGMSARDSLGMGRDRLFDRAIAEAETTLRKLSSRAKVKLYETSPSLLSLSPDFEDPDTARERLKEVKVRYAADNLETSVLRLAGDASIEQVVIFSDRPAVSDANRPSSKLPSSKFRMVGVRLPSTKIENLALTRVSIMRDPLVEGRSQLKAGISSYASEPVQVRLLHEVLAAAGAPLVKMDEKTLTIPALGNETASFELRAGQASRVSLELAEHARDIRHDAIDEDNSAWITYQSSSMKILLVGQYAAQTLGLQQVPALHFDSWIPSDFERRAADAPYWQSDRAPAAIVFHRYVPPAFPPRNALFVLPPANNPLIAVGAEVHNAEITRWVSAHPLIAYLNLPVLNMPSLQPLPRLPWAQEIVSTTVGPALLAGELNTHRYAITGFEMFPYEGKNRPLLSILTLNMFRWLTDLPLESGFIQVHTPLKLEGTGWKAQYVGAANPAPQGREENGQTIFSFEAPGVVQLNPPSGAPVLQAVNFFNEQESNTLVLRELTLPAGDNASAEDRQTQHPLSALLAMVVLVLLGLEIIVLVLPKR